MWFRWQRALSHAGRLKAGRSDQLVEGESSCPCWLEPRRGSPFRSGAGGELWPASSAGVPPRSPATSLSRGLDLDLVDVESTIDTFSQANYLKSRQLKLSGKENGAIRRDDKRALRCAGVELGRNHRGDTRGVERRLAGGCQWARARKQARWHKGSRAASPSLLGCTRVSRSAHL